LRAKTPVLDPAEARALLDSIDVSTHVGLRLREISDRDELSRLYAALQ
jgi:hypothetical protein